MNHQSLSTKHSLVNFFLLLVLLFSCSLLLCLPAQAQVSAGGQPYSFGAAGEWLTPTTALPEASMPAIDMDALLLEDELLDDKNSAYRFGQELPVNLHLNNSGLWETLPNGDRVWRLKIYAKKAKSINLLYNQFYMPNGATLHLYNQDGSYLLGAFNDANNKPYNKFSTGLIMGDVTILEYYEPLAVAEQGVLSIETVVHGYRGFFSLEKGYGDSGSCNNNVNCPEGSDWVDQINSSAMILEGGFRSCSGAMITNARQDCTPYFLTANHCMGSISSVEQWLFMFNYQSPSCDNADGPLNQTVSGCFVRAFNSDSDFSLVELSIPPPPDYLVFLSGFSAENTPAQNTTGIHHPAGDIKKISFDYDAAVNNGSYWDVSEWEDGTTESGSSGSPLYDENKRIIGQLYGGVASCTNIDYDTYGKVAASWNNGTSASSRLKDWLDPDDSNTLVVDGRYCSAVDFDNDASVLQVTYPPAIICEAGTIIPEVLIRNTGNEPLTSLELHIQFDGTVLPAINWEGYLTILQSTSVTLPGFLPTPGQHTITVSLNNPNGVPDENPSNNTLEYTFDFITGSSLQVNIQTDDYGEETSFDISNAQGDVLYENGDLDGNSDLLFDICLPAGCYTFTIYDEYGDGICCAFGNGNYNVMVGDEIVANGSEFEVSESSEFCIESEESFNANFSANFTDICAGQATQFIAYSGAATSYEWTFEGGTPATSTNATPNVVYNESGTYTVSLTVSNGTDTQTQTETAYISVAAELNALSTVNNTTTPTAQNGSITVELQNGAAPYSYQWSITAPNNPTLSNIGMGLYSVTVVDANGCYGEFYFEMVSDVSEVVANVNLSSNTICANTPIQFNGQSSNTAQTWHWFFPGGDPLESTKPDPQVIYNNPGSYDVTLIVVDVFGFTDTLQLNNYVVIPEANALSFNTQASLLFQENGRATVYPADATSTFTYLWSDGQNNSTADNLAPGLYTVTVTNNEHCQSVGEVEVGTTVDNFYGLAVYPNPAYNEVNIYNVNPEEEPVLVEIYNVAGQKIHYFDLAQGANQFNFQNTDLSTGIYLLRFIIGEEKCWRTKVFFIND